MANILSNGDFETPGAGGSDIWADWTESPVDGAVDDETVFVHSGSHAVKLTAGPNRTTNVRQLVTVKPNTAYLLTWYARGDGSAYSNGLRIIDMTNAVDILNRQNCGVTAEAYSQCSQVFTTPSDCDSIMIVFYCPYNEGAVCYIDDVLLDDMALAWQILFDWDGDGSYASDEAGRAVAVSIERGRPDEFTPVAVGKAVITLDNCDGRYDAWNPDSPLYGSILPGRGVHVSVTYNSTTYPLLYGRIEDIDATGTAPNRLAYVTVYDDMRLLLANVPQAALQKSVTTDVAIDAILDAVGWSAGDRELDVGDDTLVYWWAGDASAAEEIDNLVRSEHGMFFVSADGKATFINRSAFISGDTAGTIDEGDCAELLITQPWSRIRNVITVAYKPCYAASLATVWQLQESGIALAAGASLTIWARYTDGNGNECAADGVVSPVATTDYTANSQANGGGTDLTANMSVTATIYSRAAELVVTNNGGTMLYITLLKLRGQAIMATPGLVMREDATSKATYGARKLQLDVPWQQNADTATNMAISLLSFYKDQRRGLSIRLEQQLPTSIMYELGDRIAVTSDIYHIAEVMRLGELSLATGATMQELFATMKLEPCDNAVYWLLGETGHSELGETTVIGY